MVVEESFVTRKPLEFTLIVLFGILIILIPIYLYMERDNSEENKKETLITKSYQEVDFMFGKDSDLSESDKRNLFRYEYQDNWVQWEGILLTCVKIGDGIYKVSIDQNSDDFGDVLFTSFVNCTSVPAGHMVTYKTKLIDRKINSFIGKEGEIIKWD